MKRLIRLAVKMYPQAWRARYGEEFEALLDDTGVNAAVAFNILSGAVRMQVQRWLKIASLALGAIAALFAGSWWAGQRPYVTPGTHQVFRMDTTPGALFEFLVILVLAIAGIMTLARVPRAGRVFAGIAASYLAAVVLISLLTPRTIVSIGDSYCWDLWCVGIQNVNTAPQGQNILYTAEVSLSVDSTTAQLELTDPPKDPAKQFFYVMDEQGRRFPILGYAHLGAAKVTVKPGESVKSSLSFLAPANARRLYLTGDVAAPPWVSLYFGSDLNPFHRRTLLRVV
jgi:hypothetical protein